MLDYVNAPDLKAQWFYRFLEVSFFPWLFVIKPYLTYTFLGGMEAVCWSIAVPMVAGWHSTFLVNSAAHTWGRRPYDTGVTRCALECLTVELYVLQWYVREWEQQHAQMLLVSVLSN